MYQIVKKQNQKNRNNQNSICTPKIIGTERNNNSKPYKSKTVS